LEGVVHTPELAPGFFIKDIMFFLSIQAIQVDFVNGLVQEPGWFWNGFTYKSPQKYRFFGYCLKGPFLRESMRNEPPQGKFQVNLFAGIPGIALFERFPRASGFLGISPPRINFLKSPKETAEYAVRGSYETGPPAAHIFPCGYVPRYGVDPFL
jgi:hypothetical protein